MPSSAPPSSGGITGFTSSLNTASPNNTVNIARLLTNTASTNGDIVLSPKGTGAILATLPDATTTGGNKRGTYAIDLQIDRQNATQVANASYSVIVGGFSNAIASSSSYSVVDGGRDNNISSSAGSYFVIGGGFNNTLSATGSSNLISGGESNTIATNSARCVISGGSINSITNSANSVISGGYNNTISQSYCGILSGHTNTVSSNTLSVICGGYSHTATGQYTFIGGGNNNSVSGQYAFLGGGSGNVLSAVHGFIGAGLTNNASGTRNTILNGSSNTISNAQESVILVGASNLISNGNYSSILSGLNNTNNGAFSTVIGGDGAYNLSPYRILFANSNVNQISVSLFTKLIGDTNPTVVTADGLTANANNQIPIRANSSVKFSLDILARLFSTGLTKNIEIKGILKKGATAGTTTISNLIEQSIYADNGTESWVLNSITADTTNGAGKITVTAQNDVYISVKVTLQEVVH